MKRISIFRHGPKESGSGKSSLALDSLLTPAGVELTAKVALHHLKGREILEFFSSPIIRAQQTMFVMLRALGKTKMIDKVILETELYTPVIWEWKKLINGVAASATVRDLWEVNPRLIESEGQRIATWVFKKALMLLPPGGNALCVSHGGLIEPAVGWLIGKKPPLISDLKECEGVDLLFGNWDNFLSATPLLVP